MRRAMVPGLFFCLSLLGACGASEQQLRTVAAFEMGCTEQAQIVQLDENRRGVVACGRRETYVQHCEKDGSAQGRCQWERSGAGRSTGTVIVKVSLDGDVMAQMGGDSGSESSSSSEDDEE